MRVSISYREKDRKDVLKKVSAETEKELMTCVIKDHSGNRTHAATTLGISPRALLDKLKQFRLDGGSPP